jgi:single-stranded-DNA-specific exonuclease
VFSSSRSPARRRQREEQTILAEARRRIDSDPDIGAHAVLVVAAEGWHRGVIGIVASKLVEAYHRPAIVLSIDGDAAHGSCRSIPSFDMLDALERAGPLLGRFGGHRMAAGLTLDASRIPQFRQTINTWADAVLGPDDLRPRLQIDAELPFDAITAKTVGDLARLEPYGAGNPKPVFSAAGVEVADGPRRVKDRHLKFGLRQRGRLFRAMAWRAVEHEAMYARHRAALDLAFTVTQNTWQGETTTELTIVAGRPPSMEPDA